MTVQKALSGNLGKMEDFLSNLYTLLEMKPVYILDAFGKKKKPHKKSSSLCGS
jgi:hypothetical protein